MKRNPEKIKSALRPALFWDMEFDTLNLDAHAHFVIIRVMERGTRKEVRALWNYYGAEEIKTHLLSAGALNPRTISYFANVLQVKRSEFRSHAVSKKHNTWP